MSAHTAIATLNLELTPEQIEKLNNACEQLRKDARKAQGWPDVEIDNQARLQPKFRSWAWYRECARLSLEHDYSWRLELAGEDLWKKSNRSDGVFENQVEQHFAEIGKTMLRSHRFFSFIREGQEDETNGADDATIELIKRRLKKRSKDTKLRLRMEDSVKNAMLGGETILEPALIIGSRPRLRTEIIILANGQPLKTSRGHFVGASSDKIEINSDGTFSPASDPATRIPADVKIEMSPDAQKFYTVETYNDGGRFTMIDSRDFICDPRWSDLEESDYRGVEFSWRMDQMVAYLSGGWTVDEEALDAYKREYVGQGSNMQSASKSSRSEHGEGVDELIGEQRTAGMPETQPLIRFIREYVSVDVLGLRFLQDLYVIRDPAKNRVLAYTFAKDVISWRNSDPKHPFIPIVNDRVMDRWYGRGYFQNMYDDFMSVDELKNVGRMEVMASGNVMFIKPWLIKNLAAAQDGKGKLLIRGTEPNILDQSAMQASDAFEVVAIEPQVGAINEQYQFQLGMVRSKYGQITPGSGGSGTGMEGANTAFGMNLIDEKGNAHLTERTKTMSDGIDQVVETFARIELLNPNEADTKAQLGEEGSQKLLTFVAANEDDFTDALETLLANANDAMSVQRSQNILMVVEKWRSWLPEYQEADRPAFRQVLLDLDARDPDALLSLNADAIARYQQKLLQAGVDPAAIAPAGAPGPAGAQAAAPQPPSSPAGPPRQPPSPTSPSGSGPAKP